MEAPSDTTMVDSKVQRWAALTVLMTAVLWEHSLVVKLVSVTAAHLALQKAVP